MEIFTTISILTSLAVIAVSRKVITHAARRPANGELKTLERWEKCIGENAALIKGITKR